MGGNERSELAAEPHTWDLHRKARLLVGATRRRMADVAARGDGRNAHSCFLHSCYREGVHCCANALSRVSGVDGVETDLTYLSILSKPQRDETDHDASPVGNIDLPAGRGLEEGGEERTLSLILR